VATTCSAALVRQFEKTLFHRQATYRSVAVFRGKSLRQQARIQWLRKVSVRPEGRRGLSAGTEEDAISGCVFLKLEIGGNGSAHVTVQ